MKIIITESQYKILNESLVNDKTFRETIKSFESTVTNSKGEHYTFDDKDPKNPKTFIKDKSPYGGVLTIGWGHTGSEAKPGRAINNKKAEDLLSKDISNEEGKAKKLFPKYDTYPLYVQRALTNSVYRGEAKSGYQWVKSINSGEWKTGAEKYLQGWGIDFSRADDSRMQGSLAQRMKTNQRAFLKYVDELKSTTKKPEIKKVETKKPEFKKPEFKKPENLISRMFKPKKTDSTKIKNVSWMDSVLKGDEMFGKGQTYTVKPGDSLSKIASKYDKTVTVDSIKRLNKLKSDNISAGQKLRIK
jgi:GH24 family phage-related lysozyme (muramidase)